MPSGMASINGLESLVGLSLGLHSMVEVCLDVFVGVEEAGLAEGFVLLGLLFARCKQEDKAKKARQRMGGGKSYYFPTSRNLYKFPIYL